MKLTLFLAICGPAFADMIGRDASQLQDIIAPVKSSIDNFHTTVQSWLPDTGSNLGHFVDSGNNFYQALDKAAIDFGTANAFDQKTVSTFTTDFAGMIGTVKDTLSSVKGATISDETRKSVKDNIEMQQHHWGHLETALSPKLPLEAQSDFTNQMQGLLDAYQGTLAAFASKDVTPVTVTVSVTTVTVTPTACGTHLTTAGAGATSSTLSSAAPPSSTQASPVAFTGAANAMAPGFEAFLVGMGAMILI